MLLLKVGDRVSIDSYEGFGGDAEIVAIRQDASSHYKVRMDDGSQPDFWAWDFEIEELRKIDRRKLVIEDHRYCFLDV